MCARLVAVLVLLFTCTLFGLAASAQQQQVRSFDLLLCIWAAVLSFTCNICVLLFSSADADNYEVLGVARTATSAEIYAAYKREAKAALHDINEYLPVKKAYAMLADPGSREAYDRNLVLQGAHSTHGPVRNNAPATPDARSAAAPRTLKGLDVSAGRHQGRFVDAFAVDTLQSLLCSLRALVVFTLNCIVLSHICIKCVLVLSKAGVDYYKVLGVARTATSAEMYAAYKRQVKATIHDKDQYLPVRWAYAILLADPDTREAYDRQLALQEAHSDPSSVQDAAPPSAVANASCAA
eukprot:6427-Heterococcus_DN1.PRE.7